MTTADLIKHGALAYRDVRYYYGPLGVYSMALSFKLFGTSFTTAFGFGLVQTAANHRRLLRPRPSLAGAAHRRPGDAPCCWRSASRARPTTSCCRTPTRRPSASSACCWRCSRSRRERPLSRAPRSALVGLTRPEYPRVGGRHGGRLRWSARGASQGRASAWRASWRLALPAIAIPAVVLGVVCGSRSASRSSFTENLWPVKFLHGGVNTEQHWVPLTTWRASSGCSPAARSTSACWPHSW